MLQVGSVRVTHHSESGTVPAVEWRMVLTETQQQIISREPRRVQVCMSGEGGTFVFQPGDGTRYVVTVRMLTDAECAVHGCMDGSLMFSIMRGTNTFVSLCSPGVPHPLYLQEKLGLSVYTAQAWERLLGFVVKGEDFMAQPWRG